ncbi:MAG TPA: efflux RND transporter periplasmic adaptor subunit [Thermoanaerobaculia bacterium]
MRVLLGAAAAIVVCGCRDRSAPAPAAAAEAPAPPASVSVRVAKATRSTLAEVVSGPGHTAAMAQQKVRAPFAGTLTELSVVDGDRIVRGQTVGAIVSRDSEAALSGAREMSREAKTDPEKQDAERALALAERNLVRAPLRATADGVVLSHAATAGDRVSEDQEILIIADAASIVFIADIAQSDLSRVRPGEPASVDLAGRAGALAGSVHDVLPGANPADFTAPVRIDLRGLTAIPPIGLFGTAHITVGERRSAVIVPDGALIRDDVTGISRVALVKDGRVHWIEVTAGARDRSGTEIVAPPLSPGESVIVSGQIGLPEGAPVVAQP